MKKSNIAIWVSILLMAAPSYLDAGLVTSIMFSVIIFSVAVVGANKFGKNAHIIVLLLIPPIIGLHGAFNNDSYYGFLKDIWYLVNPVIVLFSGYILSAYICDIKKIYYILVMSAFITSFFHILNFIIYPELLFMDYLSIREIAGKGLILNAVAIPLYIHLLKNKVIIHAGGRVISYFFIFIIFSSIVLSFSRTVWLATIVMTIMVFRMYVFFEIKKTLVFIISFATVAIIIMYNDSNSGLIYKISHSLDEITSQKVWSNDDIHIKWRAYESFMAWRAFNDASVLQMLFGYGGGYLLDIGTYIKLGEKYFQHIPVLHNGYWFLLLKTGVIGFLLYILFLYKVTVVAIKARFHTLLDSNLLIGLVFLFIFLTTVVAGLYNKNALVPVVFLLGLFLRHVENISRRTKIK